VRKVSMTLYQSIVQTFLPGGKDELRTYLIRGSSSSLILKIINIFLSLVSGILIARILGSGGYGHIAYAMALIQILSIPTVMGLPNLIVRETAAYHSRKDYARMRGLLIRANQVVFMLSIFLVFIAGAAATIYSDHFSSTGYHTFLIALLLLPLLGLKALRSATLRGLRYITLGLAPEMFIQPALYIILIAGSFFAFRLEMTPQFVMILNVIATGIAFIIGAFFLIISLPKKIKTSDAVYDTSSWFKSALPFMFLGAMRLVSQRTDIIMLGFFRPIEEVGVYRAVVHGATLIVFVLTAVNMALAPVVAGLYSEGKSIQLQRLVTISARVILILTIPIAILLFIWGPWMLSFLFGDEFRTGGNALRILCMGQIVNAGVGSVGILLNMTGHERFAVAGITVAAVLNIVLNAIFIPKFGINGAAIATAISLIVWNLLLCWWVYKYLGILSIAFKRLPANFPKT